MTVDRKTSLERKRSARGIWDACKNVHIRAIPWFDMKTHEVPSQIDFILFIDPSLAWNGYLFVCGKEMVGRSIVPRIGQKTYRKSFGD